MVLRQEEEVQKHEKLKFKCRCSFLEIYNEQITDLLEPSSSNLQVLIYKCDEFGCVDNKLSMSSSVSLWKLLVSLIGVALKTYKIIIWKNEILMHPLSSNIQLHVLVLLQADARRCHQGCICRGPAGS